MILRGRKQLLLFHQKIKRNLKPDEEATFQLSPTKKITFTEWKARRRSPRTPRIVIDDSLSSVQIPTYNNKIFRGRGWPTSEELALLPKLIEKYHQTRKEEAFEKVASISPEQTLEVLNGKDSEQALTDAIDTQLASFREEIQNRMISKLDKYFRSTLYLHFCVNGEDKGYIVLSSRPYYSLLTETLKNNWPEFLEWKKTVFDLISKLNEVKFPEEVQSE